jgi:predicted dehydrogenase
MWLAGHEAYAARQEPTDRVAFGCIGVGGKGDSDTADAARLGRVVAICDVDENILAKAQLKYPDAKPYTDYRRMLDEMGKSIEAVTVSTPDHSHGPATAMALHMGKHCFTQKPLTRTIGEARALGDLARRMKAATQMGNQGTSDNRMRQNAAIVRSGALGAIKEVHVWTDRPIWPQGVERAAPQPVPSNLRWDLWLGPSPERPYAPGYHTFAWRGWWDFGSGALGDMACHTFNLPFMALDLRNPTSVVAETSGHNKDSFPKSSLIRFQFPSTKERAAIPVTWYDGGKLPPVDLFKGGKFEALVVDGKLPSSGSLIIGEKDTLYTPGDYGGGGRFIHSDPTPVEFERSPGHFEEFVRAIKEGKPARSNFPDYAGPLTETILLGNLAVWAEGKKVDWDAKGLKAKGGREFDSMIKPKYRKGYSL